MYDYGYDYCDGFYRGLAIGFTAGILCLVGFAFGVAIDGCSKDRFVTVVEAGDGQVVEKEAIK